MRLPKVIYEFYPVLYIFGGIAAMMLLETTVSFMSGLILGISGTVILFIRRNYRATRNTAFYVS